MHLPLARDKWTLVLIDLEKLLSGDFESVDRIEMSGDSTVGGIYTSTEQFEQENLP